MKDYSIEYAAAIAELEAQFPSAQEVEAMLDTADKDEEGLTDRELIELYFGEESSESSKLDDDGIDVPVVFNGKAGSHAHQQRRKVSFKRRDTRRTGKLERALHAIEVMLRDGKAWLQESTVKKLKECQARFAITSRQFNQLGRAEQRLLSRQTKWVFKLHEIYKQKESAAIRQTQSHKRGAKNDERTERKNRPRYVIQST